MKRIIIIIMALFLFIPNVVVAIDNYEVLDIGLTKPIVKYDSVNMKSESGFIIYSEDGEFIYELYDENIVVKFSEGSFKIFSGKTVVQVFEKDEEFLLSPAEPDNNNLTVEKIGYRGDIYFKIMNKKPIVINRVFLEDYLKGVVPGEMSPSFELEALKAQAICSRSFAIANINKMITKGYNLDDTTTCQVYFGTSKESEKTNAAVDETAGELLMYEDKIANAIFFSTSSGRTENITDVWGGKVPYLVSVEDPYSVPTRNFNWSLTLTKKSLENALKNNKIDIGELKKVSLYPIKNTGSIKKIELVGTKGTEEMKATTFRTMLGSTKFKSTWFRLGNIDEPIVYEKSYYYDVMWDDIFANPAIIPDDKKINGENGYVLVSAEDDIDFAYDIDSAELVDYSDNVERLYKSDDVLVYNVDSENIVFVGRGYGHGVGMSQSGANKMAELGYFADEILGYYFKGVKIN